jgi:hypothetical protein
MLTKKEHPIAFTQRPTSKKRKGAKKIKGGKEEEERNILLHLILG